MDMAHYELLHQIGLNLLEIQEWLNETNPAIYYVFSFASLFSFMYC